MQLPPRVTPTLVTPLGGSGGKMALPQREKAHMAVKDLVYGFERWVTPRKSWVRGPHKRSCWRVTTKKENRQKIGGKSRPSAERSTYSVLRLHCPSDNDVDIEVTGSKVKVSVSQR